MSIHAEAVARGAQQKTHELEGFATLLTAWQQHHRVINRVAEIGSWQGGMLWWLNEFLHPGLLVSIDINHNGRRPDDASLIHGDSHDPAVYQQAANVSPFDLVFVDGDHTYTGVDCDWRLYSPLVSRPGLIAFHDINPHPPEDRCEVARLWADLESLFETQAFRDSFEPHWGGIGVVFLP